MKNCPFPWTAELDQTQPCYYWPQSSKPVRQLGLIDRQTNRQASTDSAWSTGFRKLVKLLQPVLQLVLVINNLVVFGFQILCNAVKSFQFLCAGGIIPAQTGSWSGLASRGEQLLVRCSLTTLHSTHCTLQCCTHCPVQCVMWEKWENLSTQGAVCCGVLSCVVVCCVVLSWGKVWLEVERESGGWSCSKIKWQHHLTQKNTTQLNSTSLNTAFNHIA